jgi:DNA-directed RNA polymerase specialized sigma24 family protein
LAVCLDREHVLYQQAWREFIRRYKTFIYQIINYRCLNWRACRLRRQLSDVVNDIVSEVFIILTRSLDQYRERENEERFRFWLATICNRAAGRYLKSEFFTEMAEPDLEEFRNYLHEMPFDTRWELYESVVVQLRAADSTKKRNLERDINIFQFYIWSDLSQAIIQVHPCYRALGQRVIDNVINRLRRQLKEEN